MDDKVVEAFTSFKCLQQALQIKRKLDEHGVSWDEFAEWLNVKKRDLSNWKNAPVVDKRELPEFLVERKCPDCGKLLFLDPVNTTRCNSVPDEPDLRCVWECGNCHFQEYSKDDIEVEQSRYRVDLPEIKGTETPTPRSIRPKPKKSKSRILRHDDHRILYYARRRRI